MDKKLDNLPAAIVFSRAFLSFSKGKSIEENFLDNIVNDKFLKVLFILKKDDNIDYSLATLGDIENISFLPYEREVLFFPFSSFEIKELKEIKKGKEIFYQIILN